MIYTPRRVAHLALIIFTLGCFVAALAAEFFFSKEAIMGSFTYSLPKVGLNISPLDQLFIARMERRFAWEWHFFSGIGAIVAYLSLLTAALYTKKKRKYHLLFFWFFLIFAFSGVAMYFRADGYLNEESIYYLRKLHRYTSFIFAAAIVFHLHSVFKNLIFPSIEMRQRKNDV